MLEKISAKLKAVKEESIYNKTKQLYLGTEIVVRNTEKDLPFLLIILTKSKAKVKL